MEFHQCSQRGKTGICFHLTLQGVDTQEITLMKIEKGMFEYSCMSFWFMIQFDKPLLLLPFRDSCSESKQSGVLRGLGIELLGGGPQAFYVMYGNTKSIMNMSQSDQVELWQCVMKGDLEGYDRLAARVKPAFGFGANVGRGFGHPPSVAETAITNPVTRAGSEVGKPGRIPMRMYLRMVDQDLNDLFDVRPVSSWDDVVYVTCPIDVPKRQGKKLNKCNGSLSLSLSLSLSFA
jgi:hypothetical protein